MTQGTTATIQIKYEDNIYMVVSYTKGLSESLKNICNKYGIYVYFKGDNTIMNLLVASKERDIFTQKNWSDIQMQVSQGRV